MYRQPSVFTKRSPPSYSPSQPFPSQQSRLTNNPLNYSFQQQLSIPEFKDLNEIQIMARMSRQREREQGGDGMWIGEKMEKMEMMMMKMEKMCEMGLDVARKNQKRIGRVQANVEKILQILENKNGKKDQIIKNIQKQNDLRFLNVELNQPRPSDLFSQKSHTYDSRQNTITKKLSKTRSILNIQDRKKEIDKEISMRLKEESAKRKKILYDLRRQQSYKQKFF